MNAYPRIQMRTSDAIPKAYRPAATSSKTMPQPPGSRSSRRTGNGLVISKSRKRTSAIRPWRQSAGLPSSAIHWPATSSITTKPGSVRPLSRSTMRRRGNAEDQRQTRCRWPEPAAAREPRDEATTPQRPTGAPPQPSPTCPDRACRSPRQRTSRRPTPTCVFRAWFWTGGSGRTFSVHPSPFAVRRRASPPRSSSTSGSRTGELIL